MINRFLGICKAIFDALACPIISVQNLIEAERELNKEDY